jgi:hypothetical protein
MGLVDIVLNISKPAAFSLAIVASPAYINCGGEEENKNVIDDPICFSCVEPSGGCNLDNKWCQGNEECLCVSTENYGNVGVCVEDYYISRLNEETIFTCYNLVKRNLDL